MVLRRMRSLLSGRSNLPRAVSSPWLAFGTLLLTVLCCSPADASYQWDLPPGFPLPLVPADNPMSQEKAELGRFLFYDVRLSGNGTQACATCHEQARAFSDGLDRAVGSTGEVHPRNSMGLSNAAYTATLGWANPLLLDLEEQALIPMFGERPVELGLAGKEDELLARLRDDARYQRMFREAFPEEGDPFSIASVTRAIASFGRTLISGDSAFDRYQFGDDDALSGSALRGADLFFSEKLECFHCHGGFNFSDSVVFSGTVFRESPFHNDALYNLDGNGAYPPNNTGIMELTANPVDMGRFKAPTLRNIELTAPYMHDGSIATLDGVIDHYAAGGRTIEEGPFAGVGADSPLKDGFLIGFRLSEREREDVLSFLMSLTDAEFVSNPRLSDPFESPACPGDCRYRGRVDVDDLVTGVGIALGRSSLATCVAFDQNGDGEVRIDELVAATGLAFRGCPS